MPPWSELKKELARPGLTVTVEGNDQGATIEWKHDDEIAAHAKVVLRDEGVEWTEFFVRDASLGRIDDFRGRGIFTQALKLQSGWFKKHNLGRSLIRKNAANADWYRERSFKDQPDSPFMVQDGRRARSYLKDRV